MLLANLLASVGAVVAFGFAFRALTDIRRLKGLSSGDVPAVNRSVLLCLAFLALVYPGGVFVRARWGESSEWIQLATALASIAVSMFIGLKTRMKPPGRISKEENQ